MGRLVTAIPTFTALRIFTARYTIRDARRFDITRSACDKAVRAGRAAPGEPFAPSRDLVYPAKAWSANAAAIAATPGAEDLAARLDRALGEAYALAYRAEMRVSLGHLPEARYGALERLAANRGVRRQPAAWIALLSGELAGPEVVAVCFCPERDGCHRGLFAELLVAMGATDGGEIR
jgi:hypothetical protein